MKIIAADDEMMALDMLTYTIKEVVPNAEVDSFTRAKQVIEAVQKESYDIAFLDINMGSIGGIELASQIKQIIPDINIIFVTAYSEYTGDAMALHASGYIQKPVTKSKIKKEIEDLRYPLKLDIPSSVINVKCFGNFEVYDNNGDIIHFERSKSKELFAYLVYKNGTSCTTKEIAAVLFDDMEYDRKQQLYVQKIISSMISSLDKVNAKDIIGKKYNSLSLDVKAIDCDYYRFISGDNNAIHSYQGEFMSQYSWAEFVAGYLDNTVYNVQ